jgi:hypothetical protein
MLCDLPGGGGGWLQSLVEHTVAFTEPYEAIGPRGGGETPLLRYNIIYAAIAQHVVGMHARECLMRQLFHEAH